MEEVRKGWLQGPYTEDEVKAIAGPLFVASPRFGLIQGEKCRPIDDMSISMVNSGFSAAFKLDLDGVDGIAIMARSMLSMVSPDRTVEVRLSNGRVLKGALHESLTLEAAKELCGRTLDLEAAYKQLLVRESSLWCSVLQVTNPSGGKAYFVSQVLPFGASSSVYSFNRVSRALHAIGSRLLSLIWSNYYDDFPQLDLRCAEDSSTLAAEELMDLVGWRFSKKETKRLPMCAEFSALGVVFDFSEASKDKILVKNKPSRVEQICSEIRSITGQAVLTSAQAASLRGRLQFAESQTFGRAVSLHMRECHGRANQAGPSPDLTAGMRRELQWAWDFLQEAEPRVLRAHPDANKVLIFTDAFLGEDDKVAGIGMAAYIVRCGVVKRRYYMSEKVPGDLLCSMQKTTPKVIAALELFAAVASIQMLAEELRERRAFVFIDNEAARANLISMSSNVAVQSNLLKRLFQLSTSHSMFLWISRVPSASNIADRPSRFDADFFLRNGFINVRPDWCVGP